MLHSTSVKVDLGHSYEQSHCVCNEENTDLTPINDSFLIVSSMGEKE